MNELNYFYIKYINIQYYKLRELFTNNLLVFDYNSTRTMVANELIKCPFLIKYEYLLTYSDFKTKIKSHLAVIANQNK